MLLRIYFKVYKKILLRIHHLITSFLLKKSNISHSNFTSIGIPLLDINKKSHCSFGKNLVMVNVPRFAMLGKTNRCKFVVFKDAELIIGDKVAMSNCTIVATKSIILGNNIMIGGGVTIIDSDFHSLNPNHWHTDQDELNMKRKPIKIGNNVFIGMDTIVLKGITIGSNSIIAAGSVLFSCIPENEVWGGNPAKFIKHNS